ncbi:MAG TPA: hypothetical protein VMW66_03555, partial [Elusimicrobiales bacterium]|nr:hypothetical protein [Elusimicrobiales bacterium]
MNIKAIKSKIISEAVLIFALAFSIYLIVSLIFKSDTIVSVDGYYHIAVSKFIKQYGFLKAFQWTQMSMWKLMYSDKDLLLHLIVLPLTYMTDKISLIDKWGVIILNVIYFTSFAYVLRKYVPPFAAAIMIVLCFLSPTYTNYLLLLRPAILALTLTILGLHFLNTKNKYGLLVVTFIFTLAHVSAFTIVFFAIACEYLRYQIKGEFCKDNIIYPVLGFLAGIIVHPNFPSNLLTIYINGFLTTFYAFEDQGLAFGSEMFSTSAKAMFMKNIVVFIYLGFMFWKMWIEKLKISFQSIFLVASAQVYLVLGLLSNRFWFMVIPLMTLAMASFLKDTAYNEENKAFHKTIRSYLLYTIIVLYIAFSLPISLDTVEQNIRNMESRNKSTEQIATWMKDNIPAGET